MPKRKHSETVAPLPEGKGKAHHLLKREYMALARSVVSKAFSKRDCFPLNDAVESGWYTYFVHHGRFDWESVRPVRNLTEDQKDEAMRVQGALEEGVYLHASLYEIAWELGFGTHMREMTSDEGLSLQVKIRVNQDNTARVSSVVLQQPSWGPFWHYMHSFRHSYPQPQ